MVEMTGEVNVLLVNVSVVSRPTKVSVEVGNVSVPTLMMVEMTGEVSVLLVSVSDVVRPTKVSVMAGSVSMAPLELRTRLSVRGAAENVLTPEMVCALVRST